MPEWNSFRRVKAVFNGDLPDKVPKYEGSIEIKELNPIQDGQAAPQALIFFPTQAVSIFHSFPPLLTLVKKLISKPQLFNLPARIAIKLVSELQRRYNYDIFAFAGGLPMIFSERLFRDFHTEERNRVIRNRKGRLIWKTSLEGAHVRKGFMDEVTDWDKYIEFDSDHPGNYILMNGAVRTSRKLDIVPMYSLYGAVGFEEICGAFGLEKTFKFLMEEKNFIRKITKDMNDYAVASAEGVLQRGGKYFYITSDLGVKERSMISPRMFKEFFKPGLKRFCSRVHRLGGKVMLHACGYVQNLIPDFIDARIDALHPIESAAGNDIMKIKKEFGKNLILVGNVPIPLLTHGTPKETYNYVKYLLANISKDGGHIISSSHSVTQWCDVRNFLAYYKAVEDHGKYPITVTV